ncbi:NHL repeat-containing protein 2, partial [Blomia tropicalis]
IEDDISPDLSSFEIQFMKQLDLENELTADAPDGKNEFTIDKNSSIFKQYLDNIEKNESIKVFDYFKDFQWLNVNRSISLNDDLKEKIVLIDFFTYCCVNCLHILPLMHQIECDYRSEPVELIGIHSPKFENEKSLKNVTDSIIRYRIDHPVGNDPKLLLWNHLSISCWPTIAIIGPNSKLMFLLVGELAIQSKLRSYVDLCLDYFKERLSNHSTISIKLLRESLKTDLLHYPSKIATSPSGSRIAISNTLKNIVIITNIDGFIEQIIGNSVGFEDGTLVSCKFNQPQGLSWYNDSILFVADTGNHSIRQIDLIKSQVKTIVGNGKMCPDLIGGQIGINQSLNTPWDILFDQTSQRLYIAMAGSHQIWVSIQSTNGDVINGIPYPFGTAICIAGDGNEQKRNNRFPLKSSFAQPSGLALKNGKLFVADSESSSIRVIELNDNLSVKTLVGGSSNPLDLFAFGDADGVGMKCRLQHCMGIAAHPTKDIVFITDTFNHKVKQISLETNKCETLTLDWNSEERKSLNEPDGLCICQIEDGSIRLLVCDTNNHRIVAIDLLANNEATNFNIIDSNLPKIESPLELINDFVDSGYKLNCDYSKLLENPLYINSNIKVVQFQLKFIFNEDFKANKDAKHRFKVSIKDSHNDNVLLTSTFVFNDLDNVTFTIDNLPKSGSQIKLAVQYELNLCNNRLNTCQILREKFEKSICFTDDHKEEVLHLIQIKL